MLPLHGATDRAGLTPGIISRESGIVERAGLLRGLPERLDRDLIERVGDGVGVSGRRSREGGEMTSTRVWCVSTPSTMRSKRIDNQTLYTGVTSSSLAFAFPVKEIPPLPNPPL